MTDMTFAAPFVVLGIVAVAMLVHRLISSSDSTRYAELLLERNLAGAGGNEIDLEVTLRMAAAGYRRKVSMAVIENPGRCEEIIRETAKEEAMLLAATDKGAAKMFLDWVESAGLSEILYPAAMKAVWKTVRAGPASSVSSDLSAALRVRP